MIYLKTQAELLADIETRLRDTGNARWTDTEIYSAINDTLRTWDGRVSAPMIYVSSTDWPTSNYGVTLPDWIDERRLVMQIETDNGYEDWQDSAGWTVAPNEDGTRRVQLAFIPSEDYRILFWSANGQVPTTIPTLSAGITATDTSLTVNAALPQLSPVGWLKVDSEYLCYAGYDLGSATTTLTNLTRAQNNSTAAIHALAASVYWCVATTQPSVWNQMYDQARAFLHELALQNAASADADRHERMTTFYSTKAMEFWKGWAPSFSPRLVPTTKTMPQFRSYDSRYRYRRDGDQA